MATVWMHEFRKSSFIIIAIQSSPSQRTNHGNQKMATEVGTTTLSLQMIQNSTKIYFMITMVKGHRYYKYSQSDAQLISDKGSITTLSGQLCNSDSLRSIAF